MNNQNYLGWEWHNVRAYPAELTRLVKEGLIDIRYKLRRYTNYLLHDKESVKKALKELEKEEFPAYLKRRKKKALRQLYRSGCHFEFKRTEICKLSPAFIPRN